MSRKVSLVLLVVLTLGALLTACERPASTAPVATATGAADFPFPLAQPTTSVGSLATQTAVAAKITPGAPGAPVATAQPGVNPTKAPVTNPTPVAGAPTAVPPQATAVPPKPEIPAITATPGRPANYTIQQGDHYICIARRYNLNLGEFMSVNGLTMSSQAVSGVTVKIPQGGSWNSDNSGPRTLKAHPDTYTVASGDTLNKIACAYGDADPNLIALANDLKSPYSLSAGQSLNIP